MRKILSRTIIIASLVVLTGCAHGGHSIGYGYNYNSYGHGGLSIGFSKFGHRGFGHRRGFRRGGFHRGFGGHRGFRGGRRH